MCLSLEINVPNIHDVVAEQVSHRANLTSLSKHVKWYPASFGKRGWDEPEFAVIIGNYFWISTRLNIFAANQEIYKRQFR